MKNYFRQILTSFTKKYLFGNYPAEFLRMADGQGACRRKRQSFKRNLDGSARYG